MGLYDLIPFISSLVWATVGIRQFKGTWGWYFLIYGFTDIAAFGYGFLPNQTPDRILFSQAIIIFFTLNPDFFKKYKWVLIPPCLLLIIPSIFMEHTTITLIALFGDVVVFIFFGRKFILALFKESQLNIFYIWISFSSLLTILKLAWLYVMQWDGVDLFEMANLFHMAIIIPFLFIMHDDKRLSIKLGKGN